MQQEDLIICNDLDEIPETDFDVVPPNEYPMQAVDVTLKTTNDGTGKYINVQFEIVDGEQAGRKIFQMFNIKNKSAKAVQIGVGELKSWIKACGYEPSGQLLFSSVTALEGQVFVGKVGIQKQEGYDDKNTIKAFKSANGYVAPSEPQQSQGLQKTPQQAQTSQPDKVPAFLKKQAQ
ncbi:DUF669 domain-containing protein [Aliikangiella marina]|uniref:DUF669 domain-containing protein n=1 Tax=Aliikangiella marina TaxID=1712262 RepID=A0A545THG9_9GAMM|nr:DUF669 domain-containing protein [Aliikangiella marina]TQV76648.1 DUF669 domain-containing protein [Aliikangiella marina]